MAPRGAYSQPLKDWFAAINPLADRLAACTEAKCRKAVLSDFLVGLAAFDHAVRQLTVPAPYVSDWLALERDDYAFEVQLLKAYQSSDGLGSLSASAEQYTAARDLARDLDLPGY
jgi:hypothetical protein